MSATISQIERDLWVAAGRTVAVGDYDGRAWRDRYAIVDGCALNAEDEARNDEAIVVDPDDPDDDTVHVSDTAFDDFVNGDEIPF